MIEDVIRERQVREHLEKLDMPELVDERIEHEDRIESLENENEQLRESLMVLLSRVSEQWPHENADIHDAMTKAREVLYEGNND